jgi:hypothetical protein
MVARPLHRDYWAISESEESFGLRIGVARDVNELKFG